MDFQLLLNVSAWEIYFFFHNSNRTSSYHHVHDSLPNQSSNHSMYERSQWQWRYFIQSSFIDSAHTWNTLCWSHQQPSSHFRIKDYKDNIRFTVQVTHSTKLRLSVVQVYHWGTLVALAHTIGNEQLPSSVSWGPRGRYQIKRTLYEGEYRDTKGRYQMKLIAMEV